MIFSEKDKKLLEEVLKNDNRYISVDNDEIYVWRKIIDKETGTELDTEVVGTFEYWGEEFIVQLLNYIGAKADFC